MLGSSPSTQIQSLFDSDFACEFEPRWSHRGGHQVVTEYTDEEIVDRLTKSGRHRDAELYRRWMGIKATPGGSYQDLKGGNIVLTGLFYGWQWRKRL